MHEKIPAALRAEKNVSLEELSRSSGRIVFDGRQHIPKLLRLASESGPESCFTKSILSCPYAFVVLHLIFYDGVKDDRDFVRRGGGPRGWAEFRFHPA